MLGAKYLELPSSLFAAAEHEALLAHSPPPCRKMTHFVAFASDGSL